MPRLKTHRPQRILASARTPVAPHPPSDLALLRYPWRFAVGEWVHICTWGPGSKPCRIEQGRMVKGFPQFTVRDPDGKPLRVFQIHCSSTPITERP